MKIGVVILATNAYFILGLRFMRKFMNHYKGTAKVEFYFFSDTDPEDYLPKGFPVIFYHSGHKNWVEGTNSKFTNILKVDTDADYIFYFDADTNVDKDFDEKWFMGEMVGGEHYGNRSWMKDKKAYDRNPKSKAYIPVNTSRFQMYYYGAFFGGSKERMKEFCKKMVYYQKCDKEIGYEPAVNDESYINKEFHYNRPDKVILIEDFPFLVSDKGGLPETRNVNLDITQHKQEILQNRDELFDLINNKIKWLK